MNVIFTPGTRCYLDGKTEVIVLKAITRSHSTYNVEIPGKSFETVTSDRLTPMVVTPPVTENLITT